MKISVNDAIEKILRLEYEVKLLKESGPANSSGYLVSTTILTDAQIKALPTTPVEIIAAPGANKIIMPIGFITKIDTSAGAYTNMQDGEFAYHLNDTYEVSTYNHIQIDASIRVCIDGMIGFISGGIITGQYGLDTDLVNKSLSLKVNVSEGNFTGGNAANTLKVIVYYTIVDL